MRVILVRAFLLISLIISVGYAGLASGKLLVYPPTGQEYKTHKNDKDMKSAMPTTAYYNIGTTNVDAHKIRWQANADYVKNNEFAYDDHLVNGYVAGDFISIGNNIVKNTHNYFHVDKRFNLNSSSAMLQPNKGVTTGNEYKDVEVGDIVYARLYWEAEIFDIKNNNSGYFTYENFYNSIANYRDISISVDGGPVHTLTAKQEDTKVLVSYNKSYSSASGSSPNILGYSMFYSTSVDVTDILRKSKITDGKITVGNITAALDNIDKNCKTVNGNGCFHHVSSKYMKYTENPDKMGTWQWLANFGSRAGGTWNLVIVYDNADKGFKPKAITIFDGYSFDMLHSSSGTIKFDYKFSGFLTPDKDDYSAKVAYFMNGQSALGLSQGIEIKKGNNWVGLTGEVDTAGTQIGKSISYLDLDGKQKRDGLQGNSNERIPIVPHNERFEVSTYNDIDIYDLYGKMGPMQTEVNLKVIASSASERDKWNNNLTRTGRIKISNVVFSTDLYVPQICYTHDIYNADGQKNNFTVIQGENILNRIRFENSSTKQDGEKAFGLQAAINFKDSMIYNDNTMRIDNSLTNSSRQQNESLMRYIEDDKPGAYKKPFRILPDAAGNFDPKNIIKDENSLDTSLIYASRQFNYTGNSNKELNVLLGRGAGNILNGEISGGELEPSEMVYIDFNSTIGAKFEPIDVYLNIKYDVGDEVIDIKYGPGNPIPLCEDADSNRKSIRVFPLSGLRVVNQNFDKDSSTLSDLADTNLHTQIAGEEFKTKFIYRVDPDDAFEKELAVKIDENGNPKKDEDGNDIMVETGKYIVYDEFGDQWTVDKEEAEIMYSKFDLNGTLELSLITLANRDAKGCKNLLDSDKIPFSFPACQSSRTFAGDYHLPINQNINCSHLNKSYEVSLGDEFNYAELFDRENGMQVDYARKDYTFMISYYPTKKEQEYNIDDEGYYLDENGNRICDENGNCEKHPGFVLGSFASGVNTQGAFNVCGSDVFSVRPKEIVGNTNNAIKKAGKDAELNGIFYPVNSKGYYVGGYDSYQNSFYGKSFDENDTYLKPVMYEGCTANPVLANNPFNSEKIKDGDSNGYQKWNMNYYDENGNKIADVEDGKIKLWGAGGVPVGVRFAGVNSEGKYDVTTNIKDTINKAMANEFKAFSSMNGTFYDDEKFQEDYNKTALLYTDEYKKDNGDLKYGFYYYNIGEVKLQFVDESWTSVDQLLDENRQNEAGCIAGSSSNQRDEFGRVGCRVAFKDEPVFKFKHDRVDLNITDLRDRKSELVDSVTYDYTFYNNHDLNDDDMHATLDVNASAKLVDNDLFKDIVPTMYNSACYARNVGFGLEFEFDCADGGEKVNGADRCSTGAVNCSQYPLDSRCFTDGYGSSYEFKNKLIVTASQNDNDMPLYNREVGATMDFNASRDGFNDGTNIVEIGVNFMRDNNTPINPQVIYAEDFDRNSLVDIEEFDLTLNQTAGLPSELNVAGIVGDKDKNKFFNYSRGIMVDNDTNEGVAHFYYGNANSNLKEYPPVSVDAVLNANIYSMIYCKGNFCKDNNTPISLLSEDTAESIGNSWPNFYRNVAEKYYASNITDDFVDEYSAETVSAILIQRDNILDISENLRISYSGSDAVKDNIEIDTKPWFIYNPNSNLNNYFGVEFINNIGEWGGQGGVKDGDNVGAFLGDDNASKESGKGFRNRSINW
ncbi:MAG: hypothetical protein GXZ15_04030 [Campylobacter sp.]|nr:hypothetical protein [Campylobacter sp.]